MAQATGLPLTARHPLDLADAPIRNEAHSSGVSWGAVIAGGFVAAALSLVLLALGAGIGLSSVSPWSDAGSVASRLGKTGIIWLIVTQLIASAMGGYVAGRLRTKWVNIHTDEVFFRDTAHGFLVWSVGVVLAAGFLASASAAMVGAQPAVGVRNANTQAAAAAPNTNEYFVDTLFRSDRPASDANDAAARAEAGAILGNGLREGTLPTADQTYLAELVAAKTGLTQSGAEQRVTYVFSQAQQAGDAMRKTVAHSLYWTFLALLIGAFCASFAATIGGRQRDRVMAI